MDAPTLSAYDAESERFADDWEAQPVPTDLQAIVRRYFRSGGATADVGCGSGRDAAWLDANGYPAVGFDPSRGLLEIARRRQPGLLCRAASLPELAGVADGTFANVLCETVIMHLPAETIPIAVRRLVSILIPDGVLYLSWRVTERTGRRDPHGRLYSAFDPSVVREALAGTQILFDEGVISASSGQPVRRIVAAREGSTQWSSEVLPRREAASSPR